VTCEIACDFHSSGWGNVVNALIAKEDIENNLLPELKAAIEAD
jgi:hypothetical protein